MATKKNFLYSPMTVVQKNCNFSIAHSTTEKQIFKNGDILTMTISVPTYGNKTVVRNNLFYNTSPRTCVIKLVSAEMNGHITVKLVSVL